MSYVWFETIYALLYVKIAGLLFYNHNRCTFYRMTSAHLHDKIAAGYTVQGQSGAFNLIGKQTTYYNHSNVWDHFHFNKDFPRTGCKTILNWSVKASAKFSEFRKPTI